MGNVKPFESHFRAASALDSRSVHHQCPDLDDFVLLRCARPQRIFALNSDDRLDRVSALEVGTPGSDGPKYLTFRRVGISPVFPNI